MKKSLTISPIRYLLCSIVMSVCMCVAHAQMAPAASGAFGEAEASLNAAEKSFDEGMQAFENPGNSGASASQKSGKMSYSSASQAQRPAQKPETPEEARAQALQGSPETGYAGTWTDPQNGDIVTSVIAPTPPAQNNSSNYPLYIAPSIGNWNSDYGNASNWSGGYPSWPVTPDNPGYGTPPPSPGWGPPANPGFGGHFYPYPQPPHNFHPGYRPLRPGAPPCGGLHNWNSGNPWQPQPPWMNQNPALKPFPPFPPQNPGQAPGWIPGAPAGPANPGGNPPFYPGNPGANPPPAQFPGSFPGATPPPPFPGGHMPGGSLWHPGMDMPGAMLRPFRAPAMGHSIINNAHSGMSRTLIGARRP